MPSFVRALSETYLEERERERDLCHEWNVIFLYLLLLHHRDSRRETVRVSFCRSHTNPYKVGSIRPRLPPSLLHSQIPYLCACTISLTTDPSLRSILSLPRMPELHLPSSAQVWRQRKGKRPSTTLGMMAQRCPWFIERKRRCGMREDLALRTRPSLPSRDRGVVSTEQMYLLHCVQRRKC